MVSERLNYRLRTTELMRELLQMNKDDQMKFLGMEHDGYLETELMRTSRKINTNREIDWRMFDLVDQDTGQVVGNCGYHTWWLDHNKAEIGYWLSERFRGKGYMSEALKTMIEYGFTEMNLHRIEAFINPDNLASRKLVEVFGFKEEGTIRENYRLNGKYLDSIIYGLIKS